MRQCGPLWEIEEHVDHKVELVPVEPPASHKLAGDAVAQGISGRAVLCTDGFECEPKQFARQPLIPPKATFDVSTLG